MSSSNDPAAPRPEPGTPGTQEAPTPAVPAAEAHAQSAATPPTAPEALPTTTQAQPADPAATAPSAVQEAGAVQDAAPPGVEPVTPTELAPTVLAPTPPPPHPGLVLLRRGWELLKRVGRAVAWFLGATWNVPRLQDRTMDRLGALLGISGFGACVWLSSTTMRHFPSSADEADYVWISERLLEGRLSLPPPVMPEALYFWWRMVHEGKLVCQYPPSWPALMAPFTLVGAPWLANCVVAGLIVWVMYLLGRHAYGSAGTGLVAAAWMATNPMHLFNGAAFFPHPATILFGSLAILVVWLTVFGQGWFAKHAGWGGLLSGLAAGFMASMRPPDTVVLLLTVSLLGALGLLVQPRKLLWFLPAAIVGSVVGLAPFLLHNKWGTGDYLKPLYTVFFKEAVTFQNDVQVWKSRWSVVDSYRNDFKEWAFDPYYLLFVAPALWFAPGRWRQRLMDLGLVGVLPLAAIDLAGFQWSALHFNSYGPRYACVVLVPMALLVGRAAVAMLSHPRLSLLLLLGAFYLHKGQVEKHRVTYGDRITDRTTLYRAMDKSDAKNVVVFMKTNTATMDRADLTRNDGEYKNNILYALDMQPAGNLEVLHRMFPGRTGWVWTYEGPQRGTLSQMDPTLGRATGTVVTIRDAAPTGPFPPPSTRVIHPPYTFGPTEFYGQVGQVESGEWNLWSPGRASASFNLPAGGTFKFTVWMRGELCKNIPPHVEMEVDGVKKQELDVPAGGHLPYVLENLELAAGFHSLSVRFTNDDKDGSGDRNLRIQKMLVEPQPAPAAPVAPGGEAPQKDGNTP